MPLIFYKEPKKPDRIITMGKADQPVADYYPPGATEPIVRPAHIPAPEPPAEEEGVITGDEKSEEEAPVKKAPAKKK